MNWAFLKDALLATDKTKIIEIKYWKRQATTKFIHNYFQQQQIKARCVNFAVTDFNDRTLYMNTFAIKVPKTKNWTQVIEDLSLNENVVQVKHVSA